VLNNTYGNSLGTLSTYGPSTQTTYVAPSVAPSSTYCNFISNNIEDSCPITIVATNPNNLTDLTRTNIQLSINATDAPPSITSLAPQSIIAGSSAQQLSINGSGFLAGDTVTFNGSARTPTFIDTNQLKVSLSASDLAYVGSFPVVVTHTFLSLADYGGSASSSLTVTAAPTPVPPVPSPTSPGTLTDTGSTVSSTTPTLVWTDSGATQYDLAISQYPYGTSNVVFNSGIIDGGKSSLSIPSNFLQNGIKYRWNIQAYNSAGWSAVSPSLYFTVSAGSAPSLPSPLSPGTTTDTGYQVSTTTPTMQWNGSGATVYELAISHSPYGSSNVIYDNNQVSGSATSQLIPAGYLQNGVKYAWNLQATNAAGQSAWSAPLFFTVNNGSGGPPAIPTALSPGGYTSPGTTVTTLTPTLNWSTSSGATAYSVGVWKVGGGTVLLQSVATTSISISTGTLQNGAIYYWGVSASNAAGSSATSAVLYFTVNTGSASTLSAPVLSGPSNGITGITTAPTFSWSAVTGAKHYWLMVATSAAALPTSLTATQSSCPSCVINTNPLATTSYTAPTGTLSAGQMYYWQVQGFDDSVSPHTEGYYSAQWSFTTQGTTPPMPSNPSPGSQTSPGPTLSGNSMSFSWSASSGALAYSLAARNMTTNVLEVNTVTSSTSYSTTLSAGVPYRWDVAACGTSDCSSAVSAYTTLLYFTTPSALPSAPTLISPGSSMSPGPTLTTLTPTFSWNAATGATGYGLYVEDVASGVLVYDNSAVGNITSLVMSSGKLVAGHSYKWNMQASDSAGFSTYSTLFYFVEQGTPAVPTNLSPGSTTSPGPTTSSTTVTLSWTGTSGASYEVAVRDVASGILADDTTTSATTLTVSNLTAGKVYVWNLDACNGTLCSNFATGMYFQTPSVLPVAPTATTSAATSVSSTGGTFNGTVNPNGLSTSVWFQWGTTTALGQSTGPGTFTGTTAVPVDSILSGASPNTTYYFRVAAQSSAGTTYGSTLSFTTSAAAQAPTATTSAATSVSSTGGTFNGTVNPNGLSTSVWFQWGTTTALGQSTGPGTFTGTTAVPVDSILSGASPNTTYYFRVAAQSSAGTTYGSTLSFTTSH
jgi:hypothetical protein